MQHDMTESESSWWRWLIEVRRALLRSLALYLLWVALLFPFARPLYTVFAGPLLRELPSHSQLIALNLLSGFWVPIELCLVLALLLTVPWVLLEVWWFIKPGLYQRERRWFRNSLCLSVLLFWAGAIFAYEVVLPLLIHFLLAVAPIQVQMMPDIALYTNFALRLLLSFGFAFELPLLMVILVHCHCLTGSQLRSWRRYVLVAAFVIGMILAPDPFSQCLLAVPLYGLYELGLCFARPRLTREKTGSIIS